MRNRIRRAKRLLRLQSQLLLTERLQAQALANTLDQAQEEERKAIACLNAESSPVIPPGFLVRRAALSAARIKIAGALLSAQVEKTVGEARKEQLVKKQLGEATKAFFRNEQKVSLQAAIDAYLNSSLKQESGQKG